MKENIREAFRKCMGCLEGASVLSAWNSISDHEGYDYPFLFFANDTFERLDKLL